MSTIDDVRAAALRLPDTSERASYGGRPSWRTKTKMFLFHREAPDALVVWVDSEEDKLALISSEPDKFFTTPHYEGHPVVLVRIEATDVDELTELVTDSWLIRAPKTTAKKWLEAEGQP